MQSSSVQSGTILQPDSVASAVTFLVSSISQALELNGSPNSVPQGFVAVSQRNDTPIIADGAAQEMVVLAIGWLAGRNGARLSGTIGCYCSMLAQEGYRVTGIASNRLPQQWYAGLKVRGLLPLDRIAELN